MDSPAANHPDRLIKQKQVLWPLWGIPLGCALGIVLRNPPLGLAIAMFSGTLFLPLNVRMEGRRARLIMIIAFLATLSAVVLAAMGRTTLVWLLLFSAILCDLFYSRRQ